MMAFKILPFGFRQRIILGFSCLVLVFLGIMITVEIVGIPGTAIQGSFSRRHTSTLKDLEMVSGLLSQRITAWFNERRINVEALSRSDFLRQAIAQQTPDSNRVLAQELSTFIENHTEFQAVAIVDTEDSSIRAGGGNFAGARMAMDIFITPENLAMFKIPGYLETINISVPEDNQSRLRIIRQIISPNKPNTILAILVAEMNVNRALRPLILSVSSRLPDQWECILAGKTGDIITDIRDMDPDYKSRHQTKSDLKAFPPIRLAINGLEGPYDGPDEYGYIVLAFHRQVKIDRGIAWALILKVNRSLALKPAWTYILSQTILWMVMFVVGIVACFIIARQVSHPLNELTAVAHRIESGDLTARATASSSSEIGLLANVFNNMVARLQTWHEDLERQVLARTRDLKKSEATIRELNQELEKRVAQRTAQLRETNKELEDFVYSVSHDLRAPLRSISGFAQIIERRHKSSLNEEGQHYFDNIIKASSQMGDLIDDLLKFSRLGRKAVKPANVSLDDVFQTAMETLSDQIKNTGAQLTLPERMPAIQGDLGLLTNVFINLLENAIKYQKQGRPPVIDVRFEIQDPHIMVSVADNGIGIAPEYHEKIFKIFQRLHSLAEYPGTGIGLASVRKAVQLMGGRIEVESELDKGTVFKIKLLMAKKLYPEFDLYSETK